VDGKPWGVIFDETFRKKFTGKPVTLALSGFMSIYKNGRKQNHHAFWFEEMKLPIFAEENIFTALKNTPP
jgi:hypothetical protein